MTPSAGTRRPPARPLRRLGSACGELRGGEYASLEAVAEIDVALGAGFGQLFVVGCDPDGAAASYSADLGRWGARVMP
jgi:hypothetical protein